MSYHDYLALALNYTGEAIKEMGKAGAVNKDLEMVFKVRIENSIKLLDKAIDQLMESIKLRKVIKTIKIKDIK